MRWPWKRKDKAVPHYPLIDERDAGMHQHHAGLAFDDMEWPEYMYVNFPDGTVRRCKTTVDPTFGFPTTPGFDSPEWEIVDELDQ